MIDDQNTPIYNIKAAVKLTDVPACTLRSWESRYGIIKPARHPNGYRLYSERDIANIIWLRDQLKEGLSIAQASALLERGQNEDTPSSQTKPAAETRLPSDTDVQSFENIRQALLDAFINFDEGRAERIINQGFSLYSLDQVCLRIFEPVMYEIGEQWASGTLTTQTEHFATSILRTRLGSFMQTNLSVNGFQARRPLIIAGCSPKEEHELGILMVALFLRRMNYRVIYLGQNVADEQLRNTFLQLRPSLVCFSASTYEAAANLHQIEAIVNELRSNEKLNIQFAIGGRIFKEDPTLRSSFIGIYLGDNANEAAHIVHELLG